MRPVDPLQFPSWGKAVLYFTWVSCFSAALVLALMPLDQLPRLDDLLAPLEHHVRLERAVYSPLAYLTLFTLVVWCEIHLAVRRQQLLSPSLVLDFSWYLTGMLVQAFFIGVWIVFVNQLYNQYFGFLTVSAVGDWHPASKLLVAILVADFAKWFSHYLRHKIEFLWVFHAVHHSQENMNVFTVNRNHPVDVLLSRTFNVLPLMMFQNAGTVILGWLIVETMYSKFYHANVRLNFGPLGWVLVTPQSHRLHHSNVSQQHDLNFGFTFSIWDRLFGTQYDVIHEFVDTGIEDNHYPHEKNHMHRDPWLL